MFAISASLMYYNRVQSYPVYERVQFNSAGSTLYANLHYPSKDLPFQEKYPLVIFAHGAGWQKDVDTRAALEFTKRGFFVASIDYQGHGESDGTIETIDPDTGVLGLAQDCSKLLDAIETLNVYSEHINASQIGLIGHSLGGLVVLMNGALDSRFAATISWAGVVNMTLAGLDAYNPVNILNSTNPQNLLLIHGFNDSTVDYEAHALVAQNLTGCPIINVSDSIISDHYLISDTVMIESINWFENVFFDSEIINGPINLTFVSTLALMVITLVAMCLSVLSLMIYGSKYILKHAPEREELLQDKSEKRMMLVKFIASLLVYMLLWILTISLIGLLAIFITPIILIVTYFLIRMVSEFIIQKKRYKIAHLKDTFKSQLEIRVILYSIFSSVLFLGFYYLIAFTIPWAVFYPTSGIAFFISLILFPFYLSTELIYRKVLFPFLGFIKSRKLRTFTLSIIILLFSLYFVFISFLYYGRPAFMGAFFAFLMASVMNSIIYHKTEKFSGVMINNFIINSLFFGAASEVMIAILFGIILL
jgi:dienelactone hydrolase